MVCCLMRHQAHASSQTLSPFSTCQFIKLISLIYHNIRGLHFILVMELLVHAPVRTGLFGLVTKEANLVYVASYLSAYHLDNRSSVSNPNSGHLNFMIN